ncbi:MAG: hypothetical protein LV471_01800 [Nitrosomonas sp.]|nr:hypothetical protein [Nitrosomonas sp.]
MAEQSEWVMALLRKYYAKLRLKVNETKSAVTSIKGRKFLGYSFWFAKDGVKRKVVDKPMVTFKQRVRQLLTRGAARADAAWRRSSTS